MRALLLVGGKATRLRPLTLTTPKAMTPVLGRPFLEHVLAWLRRYEVLDVVMLLGFLPDAIRAHFGDGHAFGVRLSYVVEDAPLGSGGAIKQLERELTAPFFALNGDIYTDLDLGAMAAAHRRAGAEITISLVRVDDPSAYGVVALTPEVPEVGASEQPHARWIERFVEKPPRGQEPSDLVNAGTWLFEPSAVARIADGRFSMVEQELFPERARAGRLLGYPADCYWIDAGTPQRYLQLHRDLLAGRAASPLAIVERRGWSGLVLQTAPGAPGVGGTPPVVETGGAVVGPVVLGAGAKVGELARVEGPASLGRNVRLDAGALVQDSVAWDRCRVGRGASVTGSVLAGHCLIGEEAQVIDCVLGEGVQVRPRAVLTGASVDPGEVVG